MEPRIFISAVSHELESTRNVVADEVRKLTYKAVLKNTFGTKPGRVRKVLSDEIDTCDGLIHIVGQAYGEEPHEVDPDMGRVSYTQYDLCYAQKWGKPCWIIILGDEYPTGKNLDALDLPSDLSTGEARAYQAERRDLQARWRARLSARQQEAMTYRVRNEAELRLAVKEIKNHDAELREKEARRQEENEKRQKENLRWSVTGVLIGVPILLGVGLACWMLTMYQADQQVESRLARFDREALRSEVKKIPEEVAKSQQWNLNPALVRSQLDNLIEATYQKELQKANQLANWKSREEATKRAGEKRSRKQAEIDHFLESITDELQTGKVSPETGEFLRILQEEGPTQALGYIKSQADRLVARALEVKEHARTEQHRRLAALFESISVFDAAGQYADAREACEKLLKVDPEWKEVLLRHWAILDQIGDMGLGSNTAQATFAIFAEAEKSARRVVEIDRRDADARRNLACALCKVGTAVCFLLGKPEESLRYHNEAATILQELVGENPDAATYRLLLSASLVMQGDVHTQQARLDDALKQYEEALKIQRSLAGSAGTDPHHHFTFSATLSKLGASALMLGRLDDAGNHCEEAVQLARQCVEGDRNNLFYQMNWVSAVQVLASVRVAQKKPDEALKAHNVALERSRLLAEQHPSDAMIQGNWAEAQFKLGSVLLDQGRDQEAIQHLQDATGILDHLTRTDGSNVLLQKLLVLCHFNLGRAWKELTKFDRAIQHFQQATRLLDAIPVMDLMGQHKAGLRADLQDCIAELNAAIFATGDWALLQKADPRELPDMLTVRILIFARQGRLRETAESVEYLRGLQPQTMETLVNTAVGYGRCASLCLQGKTNPTEAERTQAMQYAGLSLAFLKYAAANGFKDWDFVKSNDAFYQLRHLPEFQALISAK